MRMEYLREDLRDLKAYKVVEETCTQKLDANESPFPIPLEIRAQLASELLNGNNTSYILIQCRCQDALARQLN